MTLPTSHARHRCAVLERFRPGRPTNRGELSEGTGLSPATVSRITRQLLADRVVQQVEHQTGDIGRPSPGLLLNPSHGSVLSLSLSMTTARGVVMNLGGDVLADCPIPFDWRDGKDVILKSLKKAASAAIKALPKGAGPLRTASLAIPGQWSRERGTSISFPRVPDWQDVPIQDLVEEWTGLPTSLIGYAPSLAVAEQARGDGAENLVCIEIEQNIAMGVIVNGRVLEGDTGNAGELAHLLIDPEGLHCHCGNRGCLETVASCQAMLERAGNVVEFSELITRAKDGDAATRTLFGEVAQALAIGVSTAVNLLNPRTLVLTGELFAVGDLLTVPLAEALKRRVYPIMTRDLEIIRSDLGPSATALGAGHTAIRAALLRA